MDAIGAERELELTLQWADSRLREARNATISRQARVEAAYDCIHARLLVLLRRAGEPEPAEYASERVILQGAIAARLSCGCVNELMALHQWAADHGNDPGAHSFSLPQVLALGRYLEKKMNA